MCSNIRCDVFGCKHVYILMALCGVVLGYLTMHPSLASLTRLMTTKMCSGIYKMSIFPKGTCQLTSILETMVNKDHVCHRMLEIKLIFYYKI